MKKFFTKTNHNRLSSIVLLFGILILAPALSFAQNGISRDKIDLMHNETPDDKYMPNTKGETSPAYHYENSIFFMTQVNVNETGENILGDAGNEPSIAVDPADLNRMAIGWRQFDNVSSNFRQAGYGYTLDGGETWTFPGVIDPGVFRSDPVLDVDSEGRFYYNSLTKDDNSNYWCDVYKTEVGGIEWVDTAFAQGGDKQWMRIDGTGGEGDGNIYANWNQSYSICYPGFFTRSVDEGVSYEDCTEISGSPYWGTLAVDADGNLYTVGGGGYSDMIVVKSTNAMNSGTIPTWENYVSINLDGYLTGWTDVNPAGLLGQAWIDVDKSGGPGHGNVYVCASVKRSSNSDDGDVMFIKSTDGGSFWTAPIKINDDFGTSNVQWFGTMSVAPNGRIDVVWLDTRDNNPGIYWSSLYYSYSLDQGETWSVNERLSDAFDPHEGWPNQNKMGDYFDMVSDESSAHLAWASTLNGEQDVYYGRITPQLTGIGDNPQKTDFVSVSAYPNPFKEKVTIRYSLNKTGIVNLSIFDIYGKEVKTVVNESQQAGSYNVTFAADADLAEGVYYCRLTSGANTRTVSLVLIR